MGEPELRRWESLDRRELLDASPWLHVWEEDVRLPDGRVIEGFYTLDMPDYVGIVAMTLDREVVIERQYKHGPRRVAINLPAGYLEPGEDPLVAARRELLEETGYVADEWQSLGSFANDGNRGSGMGHFFLARRARQVAEPDADDLEEIELGLMSLGDLARAAIGGDVAVLSMACAIGLAVIAEREER